MEGWSKKKRGKKGFKWEQIEKYWWKDIGRCRREVQKRVEKREYNWEQTEDDGDAW